MAIMSPNLFTSTIFFSSLDRVYKQSLWTGSDSLASCYFYACQTSIALRLKLQLQSKFIFMRIWYYFNQLGNPMSQARGHGRNWLSHLQARVASPSKTFKIELKFFYAMKFSHVPGPGGSGQSPSYECPFNTRQPELSRLVAYLSKVLGDAAFLLV